MIKKITAAVTAALMLTSAASAAGFEYSVSDVANGKMTVSGTLPYRNGSAWATVTVLNPGYSSASGTDAVNCIKQTVINADSIDSEEGNFAVNVQLKNPEDKEYKILVNYYGAEEPLSKTFSYYSTTALGELCAQVVAARNAGDKDKLMTLLGDDNAISFLGIRKSICSGASLDEICTELIANTDIKMTATASSVGGAYEEAACLVILKSAGAADFVRGIAGSNHETLSSVLRGSYKNGEAYEVFKNSDSDVINGVIDSVAGKTYKTLEKFNKKFESEVLRISIAKANTYLEVRKVMNSYDKVFETDWQTSYKKLSSDKKAASETDLIAAVKKDSTLDTDGIAKKYLSIIKANAKDGGSGGSGGSGGGGGFGGSGGGSGSSSSIQVSTSTVTQKKDESKVDSSLPFVDLGNVSWAVESISYLADKGVLSGKSKLIFDPNSYVTREEFVKMTVLALNITSDSAEECDFEDVLKNDWFRDVVTTGVNAGIINGISDSFFGSGMNITREDAACILYRAAKIAGKQLAGTAKTFPDGANISDYAREAADRLSAAGVFGGDGAGRFMPKSNTTRAEAAKLIYSAVKAN